MSVGKGFIQDFLLGGRQGGGAIRSDDFAYVCISLKLIVKDQIEIWY